MRFSELLERSGVNVLLIRGAADVRRVTADSRQCGAGDCFIAVRGPAADGHQFVAQAVAAGASAVVCEDLAVAPEGVACAVVKDTAKAAGPIAQAMLDWPARKLVNVGVTGTKGKSTITYLVRGMLEAAGYKAALVGTISYETGNRSIVANNTTPGPVELAEMMAEMVSAGNTHLVMEVSSHALDQGRVAGVDYAAAVFTNLTGEHLDYHKTMEQYLAAKRILFAGLKSGASAIVNADDAAGLAMADAARAAGAHVTLYGIDAACDLRGRIERGSEKGTELAILRGGARQGSSYRSSGGTTSTNALAAAARVRGVGRGLGDHLSAGSLKRSACPADWSACRWRRRTRFSWITRIPTTR